MLRKQHPLHRTTGQVDLHMLTEAQASTMLTEIVLYEKRINALSENYIPEFRKILSDKKIVLMYAAEKKFRKELLMRAKEQRSGIKP
jgi:vacuolar-type H+-ATPase subunit D/Vma8